MPVGRYIRVGVTGSSWCLSIYTVPLLFNSLIRWCLVVKQEHLRKSSYRFGVCRGWSPHTSRSQLKLHQAFLCPVNFISVLRCSEESGGPPSVVHLGEANVFIPNASLESTGWPSKSPSHVTVWLYAFLLWDSWVFSLHFLSPSPCPQRL